MFSVVQTKKRRNCRPELTVVPSSWVEGKTVFWPPAGFVTLSQDANSIPEKSTWTKAKVKVLGLATSYAAAEIVMSSFQKLSESEVTDSEGAKPSKPKKGCFESQQYDLIPANSEESSEIFTPMNRCTEVPIEQPIDQQDLMFTNPLPETLTSPTCQPIEANVEQDHPDYQLVKLLDGTLLKVLKSSVAMDHMVPLNEDDLNAEFTKEEHVLYQEILPDTGMTKQQQDNNQSEESQVRMADGTTARVIPTEITTAIGEFNERLRNLEARSEAQSIKLDNVLRFAADVRKYFSVKANFDSGAVRKDEDFSLCKQIATIKSNEDLLKMEQQLANPEIEGRFLRYYGSMYDLSGKRNGGKFFREFMRVTIPAIILLNYSWKGQQRLNISNKSFRKTFPNFIMFVCKLVKAADFQATDEMTHKLFSNFLRQKKTEFVRSGGQNSVGTPTVEEQLVDKSAVLSSDDDSSSDSSDDDCDVHVAESAVTEM